MTDFDDAATDEADGALVAFRLAHSPFASSLIDDKQLDRSWADASELEKATWLGD